MGFNNVCNGSFGASLNWCQSIKTILSQHPVVSQGKGRMIYNTIPAVAVACVINWDTCACAVAI